MHGVILLYKCNCQIEANEYTMIIPLILVLFVKETYAQDGVDTHEFIEWLEGLNALELVAFIFLLLPVVGTLLCTANAVFKWNTGCCRACCGNSRWGRRIKRLPATPIVKSTKSTVPGAAIVVGPNFQKSVV